MQVQGQDDAVVGVCMGVIAGIDQHCGAPGISGAGQPVGTGQGAHRVVAVQHHPGLRHFSPELLAICRAGGWVVIRRRLPALSPTTCSPSQGSWPRCPGHTTPQRFCVSMSWDKWEGERQEPHPHSRAHPYAPGPLSKLLQAWNALWPNGALSAGSTWGVQGQPWVPSLAAAAAMHGRGSAHPAGPGAPWQ